MRVLSLQPEIDPRAYKINTTLLDMYPDLEIITLFFDESFFSNQIRASSLLKSFVPEKHYFLLKKWNIPKEDFFKYYAPISETYARVIARKIERFCKLHNIDIIHARPPHDFLGYIAKKYTSYPVVSEIYDMMSLTGHHVSQKPESIREYFFKLRKNKLADRMEMWESYIVRNSDFFVIPYYGIREILARKQKLAPTLFVPNAVPKSQRPKQSKDKFSKETGELHLVHVGGIDMPPIGTAKYRAIFPHLERLSKLDFHVHIYGLTTQEKRKQMKEMCDKSKTLHWHEPVSPPTLYKELTRYDAGLILVENDPKHIQHIEISLPNRLFEYLSAGLFVVSSPQLKACVDFTKSNGWGEEFRTIDDIPNISQRIKPVPWDDRFCLEYYLKDVRKAYQTLV